ncbi:uncharacterized protein PAC_09625 [Phialocephala subalpina]|uniref:Uncharacterized protein n=1 Tax=Phialocephala subalpina TaxID=576137 RepID=A0A1L7X3Y9_9HELO|nr:uncharacterized protein PAC_09625 [Phialocephala subalpina]
MAPVTPSAPSDVGYAIRAGPKLCMEFFQNLMFDIQDSKPKDLSRLPTKDKLTWAVQECPNGIDSLYHAFLFSKDEKKTAFVAALGEFDSEYENESTPSPSPLGDEIFDLLTPTNGTSSIPIPTGMETPGPMKNFGRDFGIVISVVTAMFIIIGLGIALTIYNKRRKQKRDVDRNARTRRILAVTDPEGRAENTVRGEWRGMARIQEEKQNEQRQSAQGFELQPMSRPEVRPTRDDRILAAILDAKNEQLRIPERAFSHRSRY